MLLSPTATRFVAPLTFEALSRHAIESDVLALLPDGRIGHIVIADAADAIVVAPATAHWLGSMANGLAGDTVTATVLASAAPVVVAPAMDGEMWSHPATQANVARLARRLRLHDRRAGRGPAGLAGRSASGGSRSCRGSSTRSSRRSAGRPIRAPDPADSAAHVEPPREADLSGRHVVVTAGGTAEPIDPVRFIGNRSTGQDGRRDRGGRPGSRRARDARRRPRHGRRCRATRRSSGSRRPPR